jgi:hypothetical protein
MFWHLQMMKMAENAMGGGSKNDDNQGYGKQQGRPEGNPVGGGAYETGQQGYGDQGQVLSCSHFVI